MRAKKCDPRSGPRLPRAGRGEDAIQKILLASATSGSPRSQAPGAGLWLDEGAQCIVKHVHSTVVKPSRMGVALLLV